MIIDTHAHLNMDQFEHDLETVIKRSNELGVGKIIVIGMDDFHNQRALAIAEKHEHIYAAVGVHPVDIHKADVKDIIPLLKHPKVVAVGETGIDLYWNKDNLEAQKLAFRKQIKLAIEYDLPIIIHTRDSFFEAYETIKPFKGKIKGVFHSFSAGLKEARMAIDLGFYIGIGGVVTFPKATTVHELAKEIPLEHMLVETDSPFLTPVPYRGKRNEPGYTKYVVDEIAKIKQIDPNIVAEVTTMNANKLFRLEPST